ncbi:MAG: AMP-binding protein [Ruminococcus sp.]
MLLYKRFCEETFNENCTLKSFKLKYEDDYNFGYDVVDVLGKENPDGTALVWCNPQGDERTFTYKEIMELSNKAANVFKSYGIKKGDKVLVILKRNYEYWYVAPALHKLGAVIIPATHLLTVDDLTYRINTAEITAAVCTPDETTAEDMLKAQQICPQLKTIFVARRDVEGTINLTEEIDKASEEFEKVPTNVYEPMLIYFTSGTTGYPKAVVHNHTYTLAHIITARHWQAVKENGLHLTVAETGWGKASWGKIYGQWLCGSAVMVYDFDNFSPGKLLRIMEKYKVTTFCAPPTVYRYFIKKGMNKYDLSCLSHISTAGESLNSSVFNTVFAQTGLTLMEGFGQTESVLMLANLNNTNSKPGSMGKPTPLYNVQIVDSDNNPLPDGEIGEIVVIPPEDGMKYGIFMGYCGNEELYKKVWRGGIYHTGDTAYRDEDGYFWYVGRVDDLIKTRGFRVGPFEIENVLMEHPAVLECAVTGVPDEYRGQAIKATVSLAQGYEPTKKLANEIKEFCNKKVASYKWIQYLEFNNEMPKTISGKIRRVELKEAHQNKEN